MIKGQVVLKKGKDFSIQRFHPWIFSGAIAKLEGAVLDGDWVTVVSASGKVLGHGHYQNGSISIRVLSFLEAAPTAQLYAEKISAAWTLREKAGIVSKETTAFRLIHGEGDGLPGLIIDFYEGVAVVQAHSFGMHNDRTIISEALQKYWDKSCLLFTIRVKPHCPEKLRKLSKTDTCSA
jgi:23S rRNA (cytosine1962-C5)-methyltransferase